MIMFPRLGSWYVCRTKFNAVIGRVPVAVRLSHYRQAKIAAGWMGTSVFEEMYYTFPFSYRYHH